MLQITPQIRIPESELEFSFARSGGPGGQNVNKVSSKVFLRWNPGKSVALPEPIKSRLLEQQRARLTTDGDLVITSQKTRDQGRNIEDCLEKLRGMIGHAARPPRARRATKPTHASRRRRLEAKRHRAVAKQRRSKADWQE